jgi:alpha-D-ribose 1-methylphosphonate 5-triphosphate synthase subunit PhnG
VTVAEVKLNTSRGYSMILGDDPIKAVIGATVDAVYNSDDNRLKAKLDRYLCAVDKRRKKKQPESILLPASTRVNFEAMPEG